MKYLNTLLKQLFLASVLLFSWTSASALENFERAGTITDLSYDQFEVRDQKYRLAPGAKLRSNDTSRRKFSDFKTGDEIWFKGKVLNGVNYVDIISYETPEPS
ncbi:MAG: hypothetical protein AAF353_18235 [Pseudomonadota bacterium]